MRDKQTTKIELDRAFQPCLTLGGRNGLNKVAALLV